MMKKILKYSDFFAGFVRKSEDDPEYTKMFAGFISKHKKIKPEYTKMFAGFIGKHKPKKIDEGLVSGFKKLFQKKKKEETGAEPNPYDKHPGHQELVNHYSKFNTDHVRAIKDYTDDNSYYTRINRSLYSGKPDHLINDDHRVVNHLKSALGTHKAPGDLHVYSGISRSPERANSDEHHYKVHLPAFTSTSLNKQTARAFSKGDISSEHKYDTTELRNRRLRNTKDSKKSKSEPEVIPKKVTNDEYGGHGRSEDSKAKPNYNHVAYKHLLAIHVPKGSHGAYVAHQSDHEHESEFLLHPNAKLHVKKTPTVDHDDGSVLWHAKLIHDGIKET